MPTFPTGDREGIEGSLCWKAWIFHTYIDLDRLHNSLPEGWPVKKTYPDLAWLTGCVMESEHPGDRPELTGLDASYALSVARGICDSMGAEFGRRGVL